MALNKQNKPLFKTKLVGRMQQLDQFVRIAEEHNDFETAMKELNTMMETCTGEQADGIPYSRKLIRDLLERLAFLEI